jgi:hypothetical protein
VSDLPDYYAILGVLPTASRDEIRAAYRRLTQRHGPDVNLSDEDGVPASESMRRLDEAYEVLNNPRQRAAYDRQRWAQASLHPSQVPHRSASTSSPSEEAGRRIQGGGGRWRAARARYEVYEQPMPAWIKSFLAIGEHLKMRFAPFWTVIGVMVPVLAAAVLLMLSFLAYEGIVADPDAVGFLSCVVGAAGGIWVVVGVVGVLFLFFLVVWFAIWRALKGF